MFPEKQRNNIQFPVPLQRLSIIASVVFVTCELKWLKALLLSLGVHHQKIIPLFYDSQYALHIAHNLVFHERTKHIELDYHFIRDVIVEGFIAPSYVSTKTQLADIFTKALGKQQFEFLVFELGILDPSHVQLEGVLGSKYRIFRNLNIICLWITIYYPSRIMIL